MVLIIIKSSFSFLSLIKKDRLGSLAALLFATTLIS